MKDYHNKTLFAVTRTKGKQWNPNKEMRFQKGWDEHAEFMDALAEEGFIILGGPVGNGKDTLLIIEAADEKEIRERLIADSWSRMNILEIKHILPWSILLQS